VLDWGLFKQLLGVETACQRLKKVVSLSSAISVVFVARDVS